MVVGVEALEAAFTCGAKIGPREILLADFAGDDRFIPPSFERAPEHLFGIAIAVAFGGIEEVDAGIERGVDGFDGVRFVLRSPVIAADDTPEAKANRRYHQGRIAKLSSLHTLRLFFSFG